MNATFLMDLMIIKKHFWSIKNNKIKRAEIGLFFNETLTNMVMNNRRKYSIREIDEVL